MKISKKEFDDELSYLISKSIILNMLHKGIIDSNQYNEALKKLIKEYHPIINSLLEDIKWEWKYLTKMLFHLIKK